MPTTADPYDAGRYRRAGRGRIYESILDTIGDTPLIRLPRLTAELKPKGEVLARPWRSAGTRWSSGCGRGSRAWSTRTRSPASTASFGEGGGRRRGHEQAGEGDRDRGQLSGGHWLSPSTRDTRRSSEVSHLPPSRVTVVSNRDVTCKLFMTSGGPPGCRGGP